MSVALSRAHIAGNGWSLSGNGVLIIPFGVGPAIVAGGWSAIILRSRAHRRWLQLGLGSALVGFALVAGSLLSVVAFGPGNRDLGATAALFLGILLYGWLVGGPVIAALLPAPDLPRHRPLVWPIVAMLLLPVSLIAGCEAGAGIVPG